MNPIQGHLVCFVKILRCISYFYDERGSSITIIVEYLSPVPSYHVNIFVFVFDPIVGLCIMASQFWHPPLFTERINRLCLPGWRRRLVCHFSFSENFMKSKGWFSFLEFFMKSEGWFAIFRFRSGFAGFLCLIG